MRVTKVVALTSVSSSPQEEARKEFLEAVRILGATTGYSDEVKATTRRQISFKDREEVIQHIIALWPELEKKRQKRMRLLTIVGVITIILAIIQFVFIEIKYRPQYRAYKPLLDRLGAFPVVLIWVCMAGIKTDTELEGMTKLLFEYRDVRLLGACIDALNVTRGDERELIVTALRDLLPKYATSDVPPFTDDQRKTLLQELKKLAARMRKKEAFVAKDDADLLVAIVSALEADAIRATILPSSETPKTLSGIEVVLARLEQESEKALQTTDAGDLANRRRVHEATESAVLRVRGLREGG